MASKVPKFGAWDGQGGENYTVYFDNARKKKTNGQMINPNDPQENPDMFPQNNGGAASQPSRAADQKGQPSKVPKFGAWENGEDNVGYTAIFENKRKNKNGQPIIVNEPQMNRDMQPQARPQPTKSEPQQEARSQVPKFGAWEAGEGDVGYTEYFDTVTKTNKSGCTVTPEPSSGPQANMEGRAKVPEFGAWVDGDNNGAGYTAYFENASKKKNSKPVLDQVSVEPQYNRDVNNKVRPSAATGTRNKVDDHQNLRNGSKGSNASVGMSESATKYGRQIPGGQSPINQKSGGKLQQKPPNQGSQTPERGAAIPAWGVWNTDPSKAEGFTGAFMKAKEERNTPLNTPPRYPASGSPERKKGCCCGWFKLGWFKL